MRTQAFMALVFGFAGWGFISLPSFLGWWSLFIYTPALAMYLIYGPADVPKNWIKQKVRWFKTMRRRKT